MFKREARQEEAIKHPRPFLLCLRVFCEDESKEFDAMKVSGENTELCRRFCFLKHIDDHEKVKKGDCFNIT